jgi:type I restriction enzyme R subunit
VRIRLRELVKFIEKQKRKIVYADFEDTLGTVQEVQSSWLGTEYNLEQYRKRLRHFLKAHEDHITVNKLKRNIAITPSDLQELERLLFESGELGDRQEFDRAFGAQQSLGEFIRSIVGLDRGAAVAAFGEFLENTTYNAKQIQFVNQVIEYLTKNGVMDPAMLYEPPFTDFSNDGLDGVFQDSDANKIVILIKEINKNAVFA